MRILLVSEDLPTPGMGGLARHTLALARALMALGHQVDLMGNDDYPPELAEGQLSSDAFSGQFFAELRGQFEGWKEMQLGVFMPPKRSFIARRFARAIMKRASYYDVIHYHGHLPNIASYLPARLNFIQTRHDQGSDCLIHTRFKRGSICKRIDPAACAECRTWNPNALQQYVSMLAVRRFRQEVMQGFARHKTVFVSDFLRRNLARSLGTQLRGFTLHNFIDSAALQSARDAVPHPVLHFVPSGPLQVFIAAKLYPAKGVFSFLSALDAYPHDMLHISIAGDGREQTSLRERFPWVHFHGWQSGAQTLQLAARAHAIVVPSVCEEACASTVLEGLLLGKTVFALRLGGTPELSQYASVPGQLKLFDDLASLAQALVEQAQQAPAPDIRIAPHVRADAHHAAARLVDLYRLPPGPLHLPDLP